MVDGRRRFLAASLAIFLAGCPSAAPGPDGPFEPLGPLDDPAVVALLDRRTSFETLYAVLAIDYESPDRSASFEAVCHLRADGAMRLTAFKDLVLSTRYLFDLTLAGGAYRIEVDDEERVEDAGPIDRFAGRHPGFAAFQWLREALALPGSIGPPSATAVETEAEVVRVRTILASGAPVEWSCDLPTLRVDRAVVDAPDRTLTLVYSDHRQVAGRFLPGRVRLEDPAAATVIEARLEEVELDVPIDGLVFSTGPP